MRSLLDVFGHSLMVAAIACCGLAAGAATASADEVIDIAIDFAKVYQLDEPANTIIIGNPSIADATLGQEKTILVLTGKTAGTTNLIAIGPDGEEVINKTLRVASDVRQLTTVFYGAQRQTFSCAPVCEQVISVGDDPNKFDAAKDQIQTRHQFAAGQ